MEKITPDARFNGWMLIISALIGVAALFIIHAMDANTATLNARFDEVHRDFNGVNHRFDQLQNHIDENDAQLRKLIAGESHTAGMLDAKQDRKK